MPFLWNVCQKLTNNLSRPSPKRKNNFFFGGFIERASLSAFLEYHIDAGMTVEAAMILPLFLFFFVNMGSAIEMIRLHGNLQLALWNVGNQMCVYGYAAGEAGVIEEGVAKEEDRSWWEEVGDIALTYTYVKGQVVDYAGKDYLKESPLSYGMDGLQFWESDVAAKGDSMFSGDVLDIVMTYQVSPMFEIPFVKPFRMSNRYYGRLWTGYDVGGGAKDVALQDVVYIAENAKVYHVRADCTHLKLSIQEVSLMEALSERNENGGKYTECSKCNKFQFNGTVYITREGDFYHKERGCPGLKRTIYVITKEQAKEKYGPCSRCAR